MTVWQTAFIVGIMALATFAERALAFVVFPEHRLTPGFVVYVGKVLPFAITGLLVVYCLKDMSLAAWPFGLPEIIGVGVVAGLYLTVKNSLVAIATGTVVYMVLVQAVF
ncbi:MAG: branched-chain amino acid transporter permease [Oscillospiraceae bacterium]